MVAAVLPRFGAGLGLPQRQQTKAIVRRPGSFGFVCILGCMCHLRGGWVVLCRGRGGGARRGRCAVVDADRGHGRDPGENLLRGFADAPARATHPDAGDQRRRPSLPSSRVRPTAMQLMLGQPEREPGAGRVGCATAAYSRGHRDDVTPRPGRTRARGEECRTEASNRKCNPQRSLHEFFQLFGIDNISRCG